MALRDRGVAPRRARRRSRAPVRRPGGPRSSSPHPRRREGKPPIVELRVRELRAASDATSPFATRISSPSERAPAADPATRTGRGDHVADAPPARRDPHGRRGARCAVRRGRTAHPSEARGLTRPAARLPLETLSSSSRSRRTPAVHERRSSAARDRTTQRPGASGRATHAPRPPGADGAPRPVDGAEFEEERTRRPWSWSTPSGTRATRGRPLDRQLSVAASVLDGGDAAVRSAA